MKRINLEHVMRYSFLPATSAVTFDDFNTLRHSVNEQDIIYPIFRAFRKHGIKVKEKDFLKKYIESDRAYRKCLRETFRESLLDNIIAGVLMSLGYESTRIQHTVTHVVDEVLATQKVAWYPDAVSVLNILRKKGYQLGLITNTHWRILDETRKEFEKYFDVITLSYEHGYVKPHPSVFLGTLGKLRVNASSCLHVGDDPVADVEGAKNVGMRTAFIKRGKRKAQADMEIKRLTELVELL